MYLLPEKNCMILLSTPLIPPARDDISVQQEYSVPKPFWNDIRFISLIVDRSTS